MVDRQNRGGAFAGSVLLIANGVIHVIAFPEHYKTAPYIGVLFLVLAAATAVLSVAIGARIRFAWSLAAALSAISIVLYVLARTRGLPYDHQDDWRAIHEQRQSVNPMAALPARLSQWAIDRGFVELLGRLLSRRHASVLALLQAAATPRPQPASAGVLRAASWSLRPG